MTGPTRRLALRMKGPLEAQAEAEPVEVRAERLRRSTESVLTLPTLPSSVERLLEMVSRPETSARALASAISVDQVLTARLLKLANSSYYGFSQKVSTVSIALVMLGFEAVKDLALTTTVMRAFRTSASGKRFDFEKFWSHAVAVASGSRHLSRVLRVGSPGEAFTAGILHDIGQVVLQAYHPEAFDEILVAVTERGADLLEAEQAIVGATHPEVGGWLCRRWNLPEPICEAVARHHSLAAGPSSSPLGAVVALADWFDGQRGAGWTQKPEQDPANGCLLALGRLGIVLEAEDLAALQAGVFGEMARSQDLKEAFQ